MSNWKVIKTRIEVFDHPSADKLQLGKVGTYQVVVQKGLYEGGEEVVFAPEKSVLSGSLEQEYKDYLAGPAKNRVKAVRLRNELSCGIIIPPHLIEAQCGKTIDELPEDDLAEMLGITLYVPPVPTEMDGKAEPIEYSNMSGRLDVEQYGVYESNFVEGERVIGSEKLHGSQINAYASLQDDCIKHKWVSTKNYNKAGLHLIESDSNFYWRATRAIGLWDMINEIYGGVKHGERVVQVFGEAIPCQAFKYGQTEHTMRIFDLRVDGVSVPYDLVPEPFKKYWVPILYDGPYENVDDIKRLCKGMEQVSGTEANIKEGMVLRPYIDRRAGDGTRLLVKILNPKYKETGDEFN
jgi:RNA ligase (TIGR02306 family)